MSLFCGNENPFRRVYNRVSRCCAGISSLLNMSSSLKRRTSSAHLATAAAAAAMTTNISMAEATAMPSSSSLDRVRSQYMATFIVNIASFSYGMGMGWTSPNLPILLSATETPLPAGAVTPEQASWISAMFCVGGILGGILFSRLLDTRLGRKGCLTLLVVPQSVSWALLAFAPSASWLYIGRFLIGLSGGGIIVAVPVYVSEISVNRIRGTLGFVFGVMLCTGTFVGFTLTHFFGYMAQPYFALGLCVLFAAGMWPLPDTPRYLMTQQRLADAELAVQFYRQWSPATDTKAIANAMEELRADVLMDEMSSSSDSGSATEVQAAAATHHEERLTWADLRTATTRRGILLGVLLMAMTQFCGSFAIVNYSASIFEAAGSTLHPNVCGMIVAALQSLSTVVFISLIDRVGRKVLIMASGVATSVALAVLGGYFFAQHSGWDVSAYGLLPVVSMSAGMFLVIGVSTLPYVLVVELLPPHLRSTVPSYFMLLHWGLGFIFTKYFNTMVLAIQMHGWMWLFAGCCAAETVIVAFWMPETKGRTYEEIRKAMS